MNNIPWWVQAICAGLVSAGGVAASVTQLDSQHVVIAAWSVSWAALIGAASYILGKVQQPPKP